MKFIEAVDFLGKKPTLLIAKQPSHKSFIGGILSLCTLAAILAGIGYFASILFARETYTLVQNDQLDTVQTMSLNDYMIGVGLFDQLGNLLEDEERIFNIIPIYYYFVGDKNNTPSIVAKQIPLEKCDLENNKFVRHKKLLSTQLDRKGWCLPPNLDVNLTSPVGYPTTAFLSFWFTRCQNITQIGKTNCLPPHEIEQRLSNFFVGTFFIDNYFDHNKLDDPAIPYVSYVVMNAGVSPYLFRELTIGMKNVDYQSDTNYLITNPQSTQYNILDYKTDITTTPKDNNIPGSFTSITYIMGSIKQKYSRKYYKLQNMLADLGGLVKALLTITLNINLYFSRKSFFNKVIDENINSLYIKSLRKEKTINEMEHASPKRLLQSDKANVEEVRCDSERVPVKDERTLRSEVKHSRPGSNVELVKLSDDNLTENNNKENNLTTNIKPPVELKRNLDVVFKKFKINFCGYLLPAFCFKKGSLTSRQLELHSKFTEIVNGHLDILNISKKLHTLDKINYVLCGDQYKRILETTINPYLYEGVIPKSCDIYEAREKIIASFKI